MNHCHDCNSDYATPGTCNCFAPGGRRYAAPVTQVGGGIWNGPICSICGARYLGTHYCGGSVTAALPFATGFVTTVDAALKAESCVPSGL